MNHEEPILVGDAIRARSVLWPIAGWIVALAVCANAAAADSHPDAGDTNTAQDARPSPPDGLKHPIELCEKLAGVEHEICVKRALEAPRAAVAPVPGSIVPPPVGATPGPAAPGNAGPQRGESAR